MFVDRFFQHSPTWQIAQKSRHWECPLGEFARDTIRCGDCIIPAVQTGNGATVTAINTSTGASFTQVIGVGGGNPASASFSGDTGSRMADSLFNIKTQADIPQPAELSDADSGPVDQLWANNRSWLDVL